MRHERMGRMTQLWLREAGRRDPLWPRDGLWSGGESRMGDFGYCTPVAEQRAAIQDRYNKKLARVNQATSYTYDQKRRRHSEIYAERQAAMDALDRSLVRPDSFRHVKLHQNGRLVFYDGERSIELARFVGKRIDLHNEVYSKRKGEHAASVLLNGDGFDDAQLVAIQALLRDRAQLFHGQARCMIIPYMALEGAGIEINSIKRIETTRDGNDQVRYNITLPQKLQDELQEVAVRHVNRQQPRENSGRHRISALVKADGQIAVADDPLGTFSCRVEMTEMEVARANFHMMFQVENGTPANHAIRFDKDRKPHIIGNVHRLGAVVFSAVGPDKQRHRYLSGFDNQEITPMYFLAQLPDRGKIVNYRQAIDALAPPMVHKARALGKRVHRQGDVFFVETTLTDQEIRRHGGTIHEGARTLKDGTWMPFRTRNIYGTGHIASKVARLKNGVQLAQGTAAHFPAFTEPGRQPEHRPIELVPLDKWFLCVRNTVPRAAARQDSATPRNARTTTTGRRTRNASRASVTA